MKKIISSILIVSLLFTLSACNSSNATMCNNCGAELKNNTNFCFECGAKLIFESNTSETLEETDYSDFGFQNNYNMNQWIDIENYDFSDPQNAYIETYLPMVVIFENNYIYARHSFTTNEEELSYDKLLSAELYYEPEKCEVVSNYLLSYSSYNKTLEIKNVQIQKGIPIISTDNIHFETVIPMDFIDFQRGVKVDDVGIARYYIKSEYIK